MKSSGFQHPDQRLVLHAALHKLLTGQFAVTIDVQLHEDPGREPNVPAIKIMHGTVGRVVNLTPMANLINPQ